MKNCPICNSTLIQLEFMPYPFVCCRTKTHSLFVTDRYLTINLIENDEPTYQLRYSFLNQTINIIKDFDTDRSQEISMKADFSYTDKFIKNPERFFERCQKALIFK